MLAIIRVDLINCDVRTSIIGTGMWSPSILLRVSRPMSGRVDGIDLGRFHVGRTYPFSPTLAAFVVAIRAGEPVDADETPDTNNESRRLFMPSQPQSIAHWNGRERRQQRR